MAKENHIQYLHTLHSMAILAVDPQEYQTMTALLDRMATALRKACAGLDAFDTRTKNIDGASSELTDWISGWRKLIVEYDALPSEGNRERSERTAEGVQSDDALALLALRTFYGEPTDKPLNEIDEYHLFVEMRKVVRAIRCAIASPPASASMSAGVTDAIKARDKLFCEAIIATMDSSGPRMMCDTEKLLHHFNVHRPDRSPELQPEYERARANTRAGVAYSEKDAEDIRDMRTKRFERDLRHAIAEAESVASHHSVGWIDALVFIRERMLDGESTAGDARGARWPGSEKVTDDMEPNQ